MTQLLSLLINDEGYRTHYVKYLKRCKHYSIPNRLLKDLPRQTSRQLLETWMKV